MRFKRSTPGLGSGFIRGRQRSYRLRKKGNERYTSLSEHLTRKKDSANTGALQRRKNVGGIPRFVSYEDTYSMRRKSGTL